MKFSPIRSMVNQKLIDSKKVDDVTISKIDRLQKIRLLYRDYMSNSKSVEEIKDLNSILTSIEFQLQSLWGFEKNSNMHRWFDVPHCSCPKMDNEDFIGTPHRRINPNCIIHG